MASALPGVLSRGFLPTWFAAAGIVAVQLIGLIVLPEPARDRGLGWSVGASWLVAVVVVTITGAWAFPRVRATTWLIGSLSVSLLAMQQAVVEPPALPPPAAELFGFHVVAAVLLAIGAWERARHAAPAPEP